MLVAWVDRGILCTRHCFCLCFVCPPSTQAAAADVAQQSPRNDSDSESEGQLSEDEDALVLTGIRFKPEPELLKQASPAPSVDRHAVCTRLWDGRGCPAVLR